MSFIKCVNLRRNILHGRYGNGFFPVYILMLVMTFVYKKSKDDRYFTLVLGVIITNFWGIIPFALLLPAGMVAFRHKPTTGATV
jgi:hypothetical protein